MTDQSRPFETRAEPPPWHRYLSIALVALALGVIAALTLGPSPGPISTPSACIICGDNGAEDFVLNVLLFVPYGFALRLVTPKRRYVIATVVATTLIVETLQATVIPGRDSTLGDVLSNTIGGAVGLWIGEQWRVLLVPTASTARRLVIAAIVAWAGQLILGGVLSRPSLTAPPYWGEWAPGEHQDDKFNGRVLDVRWGNRLLVNDGTGDPMTYPREFASALLGGAPIVARIVDGAPKASRVPIVRVVDLREEELLLVAQHGPDLLVGIRTHARDIALRAPLLRLENAFASSAPTDTITITTVLRPHELLARVQSRGAEVSKRLSLRPTLWWTAIQPSDHPTDDQRGWLIDGLFAGCLLFPAVYWSAFTTASAFSITAVIVAAAAGLVGIPLALRTARVAPLEIIVVIITAALSWAVVRTIVFVTRRR